MKTFKQLLEDLGACSDARRWAADKTIEQIVAECHRGDWMLWLGKRIDIDNRPLTLAKGLCANTVRHLMKDERSVKAVDTVIAYGNGLATDEELAAAAAAAAAVADAYAAAAAAYAAAYAAAAAAAYAADAAYAAAAAAAAADAAADDDAYAAACQKNRMHTSDICREVLGQLIINKVNQLLHA